MYRFDNVKLKFKNKIIFNNFSYSFNNKGLYYIIGPTGCGKTTMLKLMLLNKVKYRGNIYFNEENIKDFSQRKIELIRNDITYIGVKNQAFKNLSLNDNLRILLNDDYDKDKALEILEKYDLTKYLNKKIKELSMGERQRFLLIIPLLKKSKIVLIDEGFSNLDRKYSKMLGEEYEELSKTSLVIIVEHILENIKSGNIIDFNHLENNDLKVEKYNLILKPKKTKLKIFDYLKIYKKEILINLLLCSIVVILSSVLISGAYSKRIDDDELEAMSLRALPTDTIFIDETRINPSDYNIRNQITYIDVSMVDLRPKRIDVDRFPRFFICDELNINGKKTKLKDGYIYTGQIAKDDYDLRYFIENTSMKVSLIDMNFDILKEDDVSHFDDKEKYYKNYSDVIYLNYNTLKQTNFYKIAYLNCNDEYFNFITNEEFYPKLTEEAFEKQYNEIVNFNNYDFIYLNESDSTSVFDINVNFNGESKIITIPNLKSKYLPSVWVGVPIYAKTARCFMKNEIFKEYILDRGLTYGDYLINSFSKHAYQLSDDSDVIGLVKENKRRIASGEEPIYKIMSYSNLEYKMNTFKLTRSTNDYLNNVGLSGVIAFIVLSLMNLRRNNTKILLNYDYKKNKIFFISLIENAINSCLLFVLSIICTRIFFKIQYKTLYLQIEKYKIVLIYALIISIITMLLNTVKNYFEIKKCFKTI